MNNAVKNYKIGVVGLGYVGFPLACLFARKYDVVGFDVNRSRVGNLLAGIDVTNEVSEEKFKAAIENGLQLTSDPEALKDCNVYVVAVPTPVDKHHRPDMSCVEGATRTVASAMAEGDIVIYESTVYPGATEDFCAPILEEVSGLKLNEGFFLGYSPERINPGDKVHTVENILKITSGSTPEAAEEIDRLYSSVLNNGTYKAASIKVAEAAKIMENTQRDVNIAFMNEMSQIFHSMGVDVHEVINAASTKWNFLPFVPGLVGGHCISVDPYYLIEHAKDNGVYPRLTTEARRINNSMPQFITDRLVDDMNLAGQPVLNSRILIMGFTFKENCPDVRNTRVIEIYRLLQHYTKSIDVADPRADKNEVKHHYGVDIITDPSELKPGEYDAVVYCVKHSEFDTVDIEGLVKPGGVVLDVKGTLKCNDVVHRL